MPVLQRERGLLVGEAELLGARPHRDDLRRRGTRTDQRDGLVHVLAAAGVRVALRPGRAAHREAAVVTGAVPEMAVQDVEERRVARPQQAVGVHVRVRRAALPGDGVDPFDVLAAEVVEHLADQAHALVLADSGAQEAVQLVVRGVDHRAGLGQQRDLVGRLDAPRREERLLTVHNGQSGGLEGEQYRQLHQVDADRLALQPVPRQLVGDLAGHLVGDAGVGVERAAQRGDAGTRPRRAVQPRVVQLVVARGRAEVPHDRFAAARQQGEPDQLVHRPGTDVRRGHVPDVREVEGEQRAERGRVEGLLEPGQPLFAEPVEVHPLLPVDRVRAVGSDRHVGPPRSASAPGTACRQRKPARRKPSSIT